MAELVESPPASPMSDKFLNGLAEVVGVGQSFLGIGGFPQNQGWSGSAALSEADSEFINLRYYLISNFRQLINQMFAELGLVQTICRVPVNDALRGGIEVKSTQLTPEQIDQLKVSNEENNEFGILSDALCWDRLFGGAGYMIIDDTDPETPFNIDEIDENTELTFRAVDMWELFWDRQGIEAFDPAATEDDSTYEWYNYYGKKVHKTRVVRLKGIEPPSFIRPRLRGWGLSVLEALVRPLNIWLKVNDLTYEVLDEFKVDVYKIKNLTSSLHSPQAEEKIRRRIGIANLEKNYNNALTLDSEDDWDHKQLSFAGLAEIMLENRMQIASELRMPMSKIFGISATGFNSGEDDIEVYNGMVESDVRSKARPCVHFMLKIKCQKLFGFVPDDLNFAFMPLRMLSSTDEQTVKTQKFTRLLGALEKGAIDIIEFREAVNAGGLMDVTLDVDKPMAVDTAGLDDESDEEKDETEDTRPVQNKPAASKTGATREPAGRKADNGRTSDRERRGDERRAKTFPKTDEGNDNFPQQGNFARKSKTSPQPSKTLNAYSALEKTVRLLNSAAFDRASYEADGGQDWIDSRREPLFDRDKAKDKKLWDKSERDATAAGGDWRMTVWLYEKFGGKF